MKPSSPPRFEIVPRRPRFVRALLVLAAVLWLASVAAAWFVASQRAAPELAGTSEALASSRRQLASERARIADLEQRQATLSRSEQISRAANTEVQASLAERDEEIAGLRTDVAFYERLVGATAQRKGLAAHSAEFSAEAGGTWHYQIVLTQNLNRGAISQGELRFAVEGVQRGKLATVAWDALHQKPGSAGQPYSFRYFQQLDGSVILPRDFTPQRVRVSLRGNGAAVDQVFDWKTSTNAGVPATAAAPAGG